MVNFDVILAIDWLSPYHVVLYCFTKTITLDMPGIFSIVQQGSSSHVLKGIISYIQARKFVLKGFLAYLAYVCDTMFDTHFLDFFLVVCEFVDVFPTISLPISILLYHLDLAELKELEVHLQSFLGMGFIEPGISLYGGPILFLRNRMFPFMCVVITSN